MLAVGLNIVVHKVGVYRMLAFWPEYCSVSHNADNISFNKNNERITGSIFAYLPIHFFVRKKNWSVDFKKGGNELKGGKF